MRIQAPLACVASIALLTACSETTEDNAAEFAERAAADTEENLEVVENAVREGSIEVADTVSERLKEDEMDDPDQGDGALDGTD